MCAGNEYEMRRVVFNFAEHQSNEARLQLEDCNKWTSELNSDVDVDS